MPTPSPVESFHASAAPTLTGMAPTSGPATGGTAVTLTGSNLLGTTAVRFGPNAAISYTVNSSTRITAVAPAGSPGPVQVTVTSPSGTSGPLTFTYAVAAVPTVTGVAPNTGATSGGTAVTLTGSGFSGVTVVRFGPNAAASFTVNSATLITAVTPAGSAGAAAVTVTAPGGTSSVSPGAMFFYAALPVLQGAVPSLGPTTGGTIVTLTGSDLLNASAVRFGATSAASFTVVSSTQIIATAPAGTGTSQITVTTPGGSSNPVPFSYVPAPAVTGLVPHSGPTSAGTVVTLTGTGLSTTSAVLFGATAAGFTVVSDTQITAAVPAGPPGTVNVSVTTSGGTGTGPAYTRLPPPGI
ncbi:IPT/TIG domain-containing protein [Streptomyces sp. NPDC057418]|uniref:IPT/TIG domain-containing protein n=1 Tax=unclassified Streptomyces TaxID=2593676 RepID=UPI0036BC5D09